MCDHQHTDRTFPLGGHSEPLPWGAPGVGFVFPFPRGRSRGRLRSWGKGAALLSLLLLLGLTCALLPQQMPSPLAASWLLPWPVSWSWLAGPSCASSGKTLSTLELHSTSWCPPPPPQGVSSLGTVLAIRRKLSYPPRTSGPPRTPVCPRTLVSALSRLGCLPKCPFESWGRSLGLPPGLSLAELQAMNMDNEGLTRMAPWALQH